jgi:predicted Zn finger-like uncharacterized protein
VDPDLFPEGLTLAACTACEGRLALVKEADGTLRAERAPAETASVAPDPGPTRPVVCPNCLGRYRVPVAKIPEAGAWVTCPACSERFVIKLEDDGFLDLKSEPASPGRTVKPPDDGEAPARRFYRPGHEAPDELLVTILDPVTAKARRYWGVGLVAVLALIFAVEALILRNSWNSARDMAETQQVAPPPPPVYDETSLAADLRTIQGETVPLTRLERLVDYTGRESRVYKYSVAILSPESCGAITSLTVGSQVPSSGLTLKGVCLDPSESPASLDVVWKGRHAEIRLSGHDHLKRINVLLHPPSKETLEAIAKEAAEAEAASGRH